MSTRTALAGLAAVVLLAGCGGSAVSANAPASTPASTPGHASSAPASPGKASTPAHHAAGTLLAVHDPGEVTGTLVGLCQARHNGMLPDRHCTPGSIDPAVTQANIATTICRAGYTATVRPPTSQTEHFKLDVAEPAYGQSVHGELDHLVPLELGGSNDATNLWVEAGSIPNPKDAVENALNEKVCNGTLTLRRAQRMIARNWLVAAAQLGLPAGGSAPTAPAPAPTSAPAVGGCHPTTSSGNCYEAGEFCPTADAGMTGVAGNGEVIVCKLVSGRYHWEP